jgi:rod shape-determining protein MreC
MEHIVSRFRNFTILGVVLFAQVIGLAVQVYRPSANGGSARLVRVWTSAAITPLERAVIGAQQGLKYGWDTYFYLRGVRVENEGLKLQLDQLRIQQARLREDAAQARRLQALLAFKEQFVAQTIAAQVIGTGGSEHSRIIYIDKGADEGLRTDMAVVTPEGIVGKIIRADKTTSQVLMVNDEQGGVGALLEKSRLQGIVRGTPGGSLVLHNIMNDEKVEKGEIVLASGGDRVFPKGMPIGRVKDIRNGPDVFFEIEVAPAADLNRLEEVLVVTKLVDKSPDVNMAGPVRAADMLAERLPSVPPSPPTGPDGKPLNATPGANGATHAAPPKPATTGASAAGTATNPKPSAASTKAPKPAPKPSNSNSIAAQQSGSTAAGQGTSAAPPKPAIKPATPATEVPQAGAQTGMKPANPQPRPEQTPVTQPPPGALR